MAMYVQLSDTLVVNPDAVDYLTAGAGAFVTVHLRGGRTLEAEGTVDQVSARLQGKPPPGQAPLVVFE